jgi:hypothetical protein
MKTYLNIIITAGLALAYLPLAQAENISAGPIWNLADSHNKCPTVCTRVNLTWNGHWLTTVANKESVCGCIAVATPPEEELARPILEPTPAPQPTPTMPVTPGQPTPPVVTPPAPITENDDVKIIPEPPEDRCVHACKIKKGSTFTGRSLYFKKGGFKKCVCHRDPALVGNK